MFKDDKARVDATNAFTLATDSLAIASHAKRITDETRARMESLTLPENIRQLELRLEAACSEVNLRADQIEIQYCHQNTTALEARIKDQEKRITNLLTMFNLVIGQLPLEIYMAPEVPAVPMVPAVPEHLAIRKVKK